MTVHQLISELLRSGVDMSAEVMISAPLESNRGGSSAGKLTLPTIRVETGKFPILPINQERQGKPWVSICGTDAWGQFQEDSETARAEAARRDELSLHLKGRTR